MDHATRPAPLTPAEASQWQKLQALRQDPALRYYWPKAVTPETVRQFLKEVGEQLRHAPTETKHIYEALR